MLIHELGHVRRHDMFGHMLGRIACAVYWFHPLVWTAARRLRDASERACDDLAIRLGAVPSDYAQHLLDIVTTVRQPNTPTAAIAMARRKEFEGRMLAILDPALHRVDASRWRTGLLSLGLAGFVVAVSAAAPAPREATPVVATHHAERRCGVPETNAGELLGPANQPTETTLASTGTTRHRSAATDQPVSDPLPMVDQILRQFKVEMSVDLRSATAPADEKMDLLIRVLQSDSSAKVRRVAAWGLQHYADEPAAQTELARTLGSDTDPRVRTMAAWALANGSGERTRAALRQAFTSDADAAVREMAVWGLGHDGDRDVAVTIAARLASEPSEHVRATAAWALGHLQPERAPAALTALLRSTDPAVRLKAAWALSEIGDSTALPAIRAALEAPGQDPQVTRALLRAMVNSGTTPESIESFPRLLQQ